MFYANYILNLVGRAHCFFAAQLRPPMDHLLELVNHLMCLFNRLLLALKIFTKTCLHVATYSLSKYPIYKYSNQNPL
jgi:hypothetical protein